MSDTIVVSHTRSGNPKINAKKKTLGWRTQVGRVRPPRVSWLCCKTVKARRICRAVHLLSAGLVKTTLYPSFRLTGAILRPAALRLQHQKRVAVPQGLRRA